MRIFFKIYAEDSLYYFDYCEDNDKVFNDLIADGLNTSLHNKRHKGKYEKEFGLIKDFLYKNFNNKDIKIDDDHFTFSFIDPADEAHFVFLMSDGIKI
jgi:hypothetical protein